MLPSHSVYDSVDSGKQNKEQRKLKIIPGIDFAILI